MVSANEMWKDIVESLEVTTFFRVEVLKDVHECPSHLLSTSSEVSDTLDKVVCKAWMLLNSIVDGVDTSLFALEPPLDKGL